MSRRWMMKLKTSLFWHLLFLDAFVLHFRYGGMSVKDLIFHGVCLGLATLLLALHKKTHTVSKLYIWLFGGALSMIMLQLMPLPQFLFPILAPIKHRVLSAITSIYPDIQYTTQIAILPDVAPIKLITLLLDMYLILLALMAPKPKMSLYRFWLVALSLSTASLAVVTSWEGPFQSGLASFYQGTYGGLVNPNNFAALANIFMPLLLAQVILSIREIVVDGGNERDTRQLLKKMVFLIFYSFCYLHVFFGFQTIRSQSGMLGFLLTHILLGIFLLREFGQPGRTRFLLGKRMLAAILYTVLVVGAVSLLPLSKGPVELKEKGLVSEARTSFTRIGLDYLGEYPILGAGLGASECILEAVQPQRYHKEGNARHFNNEYLQYAIELGLPGMAALFLFMALVVRGLTPGFSLESPEQRYYFYGLASVLIFLALLCAASFPLRVTSIRVLAIILTFLGVKLAVQEKRKDNPRALLGMIAMILVACLAWLYPAAVYKPQQGAHLEAVKRSIRYGRPYKEHFFSANDKLAKFFKSASFSQEGRDQLVEIQNDVYQSLEHQQFNIKAYNILFITDALLDKLDHPEYSEERYLKLRHKAQVINDLGKGANVNSQSTLLFIYGMYEEHLNEEDLQAYSVLKEVYASNLRAAEKKLREQAEQDQ